MALPKTKEAVVVVSDDSCYLVSLNSTRSNGEMGVWGVPKVFLSGWGFDKDGKLQTVRISQPSFVKKLGWSAIDGSMNVCTVGISFTISQLTMHGWM